MEVKMEKGLTIFEQTKEIYEAQKRRLEAELKDPDLPAHRKITVEACLYNIGEILREFERREKETSQHTEARWKKLAKNL
jgi:hypothetical protein